LSWNREQSLVEVRGLLNMGGPRILPWIAGGTPVPQLSVKKASAGGRPYRQRTVRAVCRQTPFVR